MRPMELAQQSTLTLVLIFSLGVTPGAQVSSENSTERLHQLFEEEWQQTLRDYPTWASLMGDRRYNRLWPDVSLTAIEKRQQRHLQLLHRLDEIDPSSLSPADRLNYSLFRKKQELQQEGFQYGWHLLPLTHRGGIQTANELSDSLSFDTLQDYEDWIARLEALPVYVEQTIQLMRRGIQMGMLPARIIMDRVPDQIAFQVVIDASSSSTRRACSSPKSGPTSAGNKRLSSATKWARTLARKCGRVIRGADGEYGDESSQSGA